MKGDPKDQTQTSSLTQEPGTPIQRISGDNAGELGVKWRSEGGKKKSTISLIVLMRAKEKR